MVLKYLSKAVNNRELINESDHISKEHGMIPNFRSIRCINANAIAHIIKEFALAFRAVYANDLIIHKTAPVEIYVPYLKEYTLVRILEKGEDISTLTNYIKNDNLLVVFVKNDDWNDFLNAHVKAMKKVSSLDTIRPDEVIRIFVGGMKYIAKTVVENISDPKTHIVCCRAVEFMSSWLVERKTKRHIAQFLKYITDNAELYTHMVQTYIYSFILTYNLTWDLDMIKNTCTAAIFHDVGKAMIPESILTKRSPLTNSEWEIIKQHPVKGYNILHPSGELHSSSLKGVLLHHENMDGSGYPHGLTGYEIPLTARIIRICDTYDALTSDRHYRQKLRPSEALELMLKEKGKYDADLFKAFVSSILEYSKYLK